MATKTNHIGIKLSMLAKTCGVSQTELADKLGFSPSQVNRFFNGHSDIYSSNLLEILKELGFDIAAMVSKRLKAVTDEEHSEPQSTKETLLALFDELDELGKQTCLSQMLFTAKAGRKSSFPKKLELQIKKVINLI